MANKVGAGYVDIEPQVDARDLKALKRKIETFLADTKANIQVDVKATELNKLRQKIKQYIEEKTFYLKVDVRATTLTALRKKIEEALTIRPIYIDIDVRARDIAATRAKIEAGLAGINVDVGTRGGGGGNNRRPNVPNLPGNGGGGGGRRRRRSFGSAAAGGGLSGIANAFQLSGPIGGSAILVIAAALAAAAPALGSMLGGLIFASLGALPLAGAIMIGLQDPKVTKGLTDFKNKFVKLVVDPLKGEFGTTLLNIIDQFSTAMERWAPLLQSILRAGMSFAQPIATGIETSIDNFLPGFDKLVNSDFMKKIMDNLANGFLIIVDGFNEIFNDILNDPKAQAGFAAGVTDFFKAVKIVLVGAFDFLRWLARTWVTMNTPDESGVTTVDRIKTVFEKIADIMKVLISTVFTKENIDAALDSLDGIFGFLDGLINNDIVKELLGAAANIGGAGAQTPTGNDFWDGFVKSFKQALNPLEIFMGEENQQKWKDLGTQLKTDWNRLIGDLETGWDNFTAWLSRSWETIKGWWSGFTGWLSAEWDKFTAWITEKWNTFWAPFVTAWNNIKTGWSNLINGSFMGGWTNWDTWIREKLSNFAAPFSEAWKNIKAGWNDLVVGLRGIWDSFFSWLTGKSNSVMAKVTKTPTTSSGGGNNTTTAGKRFGGLMKFAGGGLAVGAGSGISDSIPAMISNGEFVVNAKSTQANLGMLNAINNGASYQPNINVYVDGVAVAHRAVVSDAFRSVTGYLTAGRSD